MPDSPAHIRAYSSADYEAVKALIMEGNLYFEEQDSAEKLEMKISHDPESILVAEVDSQVVGTVFIVEDGGWVAFVFRLVVSKTHRGKGIATALLDKATEIIRERGHNDVTVLVDEDDEELQQFYAKKEYERGGNYRWMFKPIKR